MSLHCWLPKLARHLSSRKALQQYGMTCKRFGLGFGGAMADGGAGAGAAAARRRPVSGEPHAAPIALR